MAGALWLQLMAVATSECSSGFKPSGRAPDLVVIGGTVADLVASPEAGGRLLEDTSVPGTLCISAGGVGRNIAEALTRLDTAPLFLSALADDGFAQLLERGYTHQPTGKLAAQTSFGMSNLNGAPKCALDMSAVRRVAGARTATFTALQTYQGELAMAVADMSINARITPDYLQLHASTIQGAVLCVADANLPTVTLQWLAQRCGGRDECGERKARPYLWLEPVSVPKAVAACYALRAGGLQAIDFVSPNEEELLAMAATVEPSSELDQQRKADQVILEKTGDSSAITRKRDSRDSDITRAASALVRAGIRNVIVTRGASGVLWARAASESETGNHAGMVFESLPAPLAAVRNTRGAGDSFVAGAVWGLLNAHSLAQSSYPATKQHTPPMCSVQAVRDALRSGLIAAKLTVESELAVSEELCAAALADCPSS
eukprot:CAMPEP_0119327352 /NCGR_PEP_ID=MMETSP1333-20130426/70585_1 /TAXON_ID=418940 /ORGANISM="Scyphosphaera apsteinii, Strain RCC1455" /LENGTH=431 /DNA_ID=CAMNT_0007335925 /DNA_START=263 /DNA_END=1558 /DNA_ORIENTATION=+